jgi:hypothetical protein
MPPFLRRGSEKANGETVGHLSRSPIYQKSSCSTCRKGYAAFCYENSSYSGQRNNEQSKKHPKGIVFGAGGR